MRIAFLLNGSPSNGRRPAVSPVTAETIVRLRAKGAEVDLIVPEAEPLDLSDLRPRHDLYVLKSQTPLALSWAGALEAMGASLVNTYRSSALAGDKVAATAMLAAAGVPVPPSWATGRSASLSSLLEEGALWLKPPAGRHGIGVRRLGSAADLHGAEDPTDACGLPLPLFAQREAPSAGFDLKVYAVGERLWAIAKRFPARTALDKLGTPARLAPEVRATALLCGRVLGLEIYGVDVLVSRNRFVVVDVNAFPGYKGVTSAPGYLAEHIYHRALRLSAAGVA